MELCAQIPPRTTRRPGGEEDWTANAVDYQSVILQIDTDQNTSDSRISTQTVVALAQSTLVTDPAMEKSLGLKAVDARSVVSINAQVNGNRFVQLTVSIRPGNDHIKPGSSAVLIIELCDRIRAAAAQSAEAQSRILDQKKKHLQIEFDAAREKWIRLSAELKDARANNPNNNGGDNNPRYQLQNLTQQKEQIELVLAGLKARLKSMSDLMKEDAAAHPPTTAPTAVGAAGAWDQVIEMRKKILDDATARLEKKEATPTEVATAQMMLADANAWSAAMSARPVAPIISRDGYDIASLKSSVAENEARLEVLKQQIAKQPAASDSKAAISYDDINRLQSDEQLARNEMDMALQPLTEMKRNNRSAGSFTLTVLDGAAAKPE